MRWKKTRRKRDDVLAAAGVTVRAVRDSADVFPPLKTAASALITICDIIQRTKSNKEECIQVANRAAQIIHDIWRQIKDYEDGLPVEITDGVISIENLFGEIIIFLEGLSAQSGFQRYCSRQTENKGRIDGFRRRLEDSLESLNIALQLSVLRADIKMSTTLSNLQKDSSERHVKVLEATLKGQAQIEKSLNRLRAEFALGFCFFG